MSDTIGVVTTGGTIGSVLGGASVGVDPNSAIVLREIEALRRQHGLTIEVRAALNKNSEDIVPADWATIVETVRDFIARGVSRIVVTHGTDTLPFSAAVLAILFQSSAARICVTGSYLSLSHPQSDGSLNLVAAFCAVASDATPPGVYVAFRTNGRNDEAAILPAFDVKPMGFDDVAFAAAYGRRVATYAPSSGYRVEAGARISMVPLLAEARVSPASLARAGSEVALVHAYPGLSLRPLASSGIAAVVLGLYHSGTAPSQAGGGSSLVDEIAALAPAVPVLCASFPAPLIPVPYESTLRLMRAGAVIYNNLQPHALYVFLVLARAAGLDISVARSVLAGLERRDAQA